MEGAECYGIRGAPKATSAVEPMVQYLLWSEYLLLWNQEGALGN